MQKRVLTFRQLGLSPAKEVERFPKRPTEGQNDHAEKAKQLLEDESKKYPLHDVKMLVDHGRRTVTFSYLKRDLELERLNRQTKEVGFRIELDKIKRRFQGGTK